MVLKVGFGIQPGVMKHKVVVFTRHVDMKTVINGYSYPWFSLFGMHCGGLVSLKPTAEVFPADVLYDAAVCSETRTKGYGLNWLLRRTGFCQNH